MMPMTTNSSIRVNAPHDLDEVRLTHRSRFLTIHLGRGPRLIEAAAESCVRVREREISGEIGDRS